MHMDTMLKIEGHLFEQARQLLNAVIASTIGEMVKKEFEEGSVTLKIKIGLEEVSDQEKRSFEPAIEWEVANSLKKSAKQKGSVDCVGKRIGQVPGNPYEWMLQDAGGQMCMEDIDEDD